MYYNYGRRRVNDWINLPDRPEGMNRRSQRYFLEFKVIEKEFARNNTILYFLIKRMGMHELTGLFGSCQKQKKLVQATKLELKRYAMTQEWERVFDQDVASLHRRTEYVLYIIKANLKLTELYPYFEAEGFAKLMDFAVKPLEDRDETDAELRKDIAEWNACHQEEIRKHMEDTAEERENLMSYRARIAEDNRKEKEERKTAKREAKAELKEIRDNNRKYLKRKHLIDRSFAGYYK